MPENRRAAPRAEFAVDALGAVEALQGAGTVIERRAVELRDVGFGHEGPGLDVEARGEAAGGAGAGAGEVFGVVFAEVPGLMVP